MVLFDSLKTALDIFSVSKKSTMYENTVIPSEVEESTHFVNICSQLGAKILRLAPLAQDDNYFGFWGLTTKECHCEERSDVAIRIPKSSVFIRNSGKIGTFKRTDSHASVRTGSE